MRRQKISRDGIQIYRSSRQQTHTTTKPSRRFLLAAVQLPAVWFLAASWWMNLTSIFPIQADTLRLYCTLFFFTAILTFLWNMPLRIPGKIIILAVLCGIAGCWIRLHVDAAVNIINSAANAYLSVCRPKANPYPVTTLPELHMAVMTGLFLAPLIILWSLSLHLNKGRVFSMLLLLTPAAFSLIINLVPSEASCWLVILSGGLFCAVYRCKNGRAAFVNGIAAACILAVIVGFSAFISRPLEQYKKPSDSLYAETRVFIQTKWITPARNYVKQAQESRHEKNDRPDTDAADAVKNTAESDTPENADNPNNGTKPADGQNQPGESSATLPDGQTILPSDAIVDIPDHAVDAPLFSTDGNSNDGSLENNGSAVNAGSRADGFPDLNSLTHFQPDYGVRMTLSLDTKPKETYYHPVTYGGIYADGRWNEIQTDDAGASEYLQYPGTVSRLEELCRTQSPKTLAEVSDFIRQEFKENTVYDYEPGAVPSGQDFAEYFLFENQKGFCVHFSTTAALMYRICGFPSRYVQGYAIPASAFHRQEDGTYLAEITGEMGHAWCEVYSDSEWILKEHTLPYHGVRPAPGTPAASSGKRTWRPNAAGWFLLILKFFAKILLVFFAAAILLFVQSSLRRRRKYQHFRQRKGGAGIQHIYRAIYDSAIFHGMQEVDFLSREGFGILQKYCPGVDMDSMEWLYEAVMETMFYKREITKEELQRAKKLYQQFSNIIKKDLGAYRRFIYLYVRIL